MGEDMRLRDYSERTQEAYLLAFRLFLEWAKNDPRRSRTKISIVTFVTSARSGNSRVKKPCKLSVILSPIEVAHPRA
jgi:hypothetical protein